MEMEKLLSRMKFSNGSGNTWLWESSIIKSLFFSFFFFSTVQELTNCQGFCSRITFLCISFTTSSSALQELTFKFCLLANN